MGYGCWVDQVAQTLIQGVSIVGDGRPLGLLFIIPFCYFPCLHFVFLRPCSVVLVLFPILLFPFASVGGRTHARFPHFPEPFCVDFFFALFYHLRCDW